MPESSLHEELIEDAILALLGDAQLEIRKLDSIDGWEISEKTIPKILGIVPCVLVGIGDIEFTDRDNAGTVQLTSPAELLVYVADSNDFRRREAASRIRTLKRQIRNLLRGRVLTMDNGVRVLIRLRRDAVALSANGLIMYEQLYHVTALDCNVE